jgi:hypothetical protein
MEAMTANRRDEADLQIDENGDLVVVPGVESLLNSISERFARMADEARLEFNRAYFASRPEPPGLARNRRRREAWLRMSASERERQREDRALGLWWPTGGSPLRAPRPRGTLLDETDDDAAVF